MGVRKVLFALASPERILAARRTNFEELILDVPLSTLVANHWALSESIASPERGWESWQAEHRQVIPMAVEKLGIKSLYEIGCGSGPNLRLLTSRLPWLQVAGCDIRDEYVTFAQKRGLLVDVLALPGVITGYDAVLSCYMMAYLDPEQVEGQLRAIRCPWLLLMEPSTKDSKEVLWRSNNSIPRWYHDWETLLANTGWVTEGLWPLKPVVDSLRFLRFARSTYRSNYLG